MARREGEVIARGPGRWLVRWTTGQDAAGIYRAKSKTIRGTKRDAERELRKILRDRDTGEYVEPMKLTLDAYLDRWLESAANQVSKRTLMNIRSMLRTQVRPVLGTYHLQKLTTVAVQGMIDGMSKRAKRPLSPRTHQLALTYLSQALRQAVDWNILARNPAKGVILPKRADDEASAGKQNERRSFTREELRNFLGAARGTKHEALWLLMATTGCRPGEALALTWADLTPEGVTFNKAVTHDGTSHLLVGPIKNKKTRRVPLPSPVLEALKMHKATQRQHMLRMGPRYDRARDLIFPNSLGRLLAEDGLRYRHFWPVAEKAGIPRRKGDGPDLFRHTVVTHLLLAGEAPQTVAERVGDTVVTIMEHYAHVLPGLQQKATATISALVFGDS